ncbi:hypothetical protein N476_04705 [Pseudoalteromonas luteoviolacea H33]|uniref:Uncharacterized protein n=1 Tax=Pseudoalteromonas luteoviolacea H33 TaxID=1365251 RepID=A0A161ZME1_9GAMM|nr:hypothetical protein N476_04705 [Pseudoalteromonas luteoviolacea H33]KZN70818.1 hypothetical protein N477_05335 [Pseudoalteromonas luteoviolacea H33-S]
MNLHLLHDPYQVIENDFKLNCSPNLEPNKSLANVDAFA